MGLMQAWGALAGLVFAAGLVMMLRALLPGLRGAVGVPPALVRAATWLWNGPGRSRARRKSYRLAAAAMAAAAVVTWLVSGLPVLGVLAAAAVPGVPWLLAAGSAERRAITRLEAVGDWTRRLRDITGTGAGLQSAIVTAAATAPAPIEEQTKLLAARLQAAVPARQALLEFADEIDDSVCDQIVAALLLHLRDRGEKLGTVLTAIADAAGREVAVRTEVDAERSGARFSIRFMVGFSLLVVAVAAVAGDYMAPYGTGYGQLVMTVLAGGFIAVLLWVRRLTSPTSVPRMFGNSHGVAETDAVPAAAGVRR